jgi:1-acyl-sn-glycerol-3-phosphate acyltransferase
MLLKNLNTLDWLRLPYSLYIVTVFFLYLPFQIVLYVFIKIFSSYSRQIYWVHKANRMMFLIWSALTFFRYRIRGLENIDPDQTYIVVCNHNNNADIVAAAYGIQVTGKPLVKKELLKIPLLGQLFAMASVPVDRNTDQGRKKSMEIMRKELSQGISLIIFPEGTRNRSDQPLKKFHNGAFALSLESGIPVIPVVFANIRQISKPESYLFRPWTLEIHHLPPVSPAGMGPDDIEKYKEMIFNQMWNFIVEKDSQFKNTPKV